MNVFQFVGRVLKGFIPAKYPEDANERKRIKAFILGAGAGCGKIEEEQDESRKSNS